MMLQNACIRYDKTLKEKPSTTYRAVYQRELDEDPSVHDEGDDYLDDNFTPDDIDTLSIDFYNIHNTNFNRAPHVKSLIPRTPPGVPLKPRYNGPVYLPKHIVTIWLVMMSRRNWTSTTKKGSIQATMSQDGQGLQARS